MWGAVHELTPVLGGGGYLNAISCSDATDCTAVGYDLNSGDQPIYATETSGSWSGATEIPAPGGAGMFNGVSCVDAADCTAVGEDGYGQPIYATETSGVWGGATETSAPGGGGQFNGVSCTTAGGCTAVGEDANHQPIYATEASGSWSGAAEISTPGFGGQFNGVSCVDAADCTAVGAEPKSSFGYDNAEPIYATETSGSWSGAIDLSAPNSGGQFNGVSCTPDVGCTAVGSDLGEEATYSIATFTVPGTPTIGTATRGNSQASAAFSAPASNGGSAITSYRVLESSGGGYSTATTSPATCTVSPCTVTGLTNGTAYTFEVEATNGVGTGLASSPSNSVTPAAVPGTPTIGTATRGNSQASVAFSAPASNGGSAITSYRVLESSGGGYSTATTSPATCTVSPCTVTGLTNGTAYTFEVEATNGVGTGLASSPSNSVTPAAVPGTPTIGTATRGNSQASVAFSAPASNGGSADHQLQGARVLRRRLQHCYDVAGDLHGVAVHGDGADQRHGLHVRGRGHERRRDGVGVVAVQQRDPRHGSRAAHDRQGDPWQQVGQGQVDSAGVGRGLCDHWLHRQRHQGNPHVHLHHVRHKLHDPRPQKRQEVHRLGGRNERDWKLDELCHEERQATTMRSDRETRSGSSGCIEPPGPSSAHDRVWPDQLPNRHAPIGDV